MKPTDFHFRRCTCPLCAANRRQWRRLAWAVGLVALAAACLILAPGCSLPQWRVFQRQVPATQSEKPARQVEGERQGAALIRELTSPPVPDPGHAVQQVHAVAVDLSASLGEPAQPVRVEDQAAVVAALRSGLAAKDRQLDQWRQFGRKYGGTPLEGTGINLAGPAGLVGLVGVVVLCVAVPPIGYALLRCLPVLWGYFRSTTRAVADYAAAHPEAGDELKAQLSRRMDRAHKRLVKARAPASVS